MRLNIKKLNEYKLISEYSTNDFLTDLRSNKLSIGTSPSRPESDSDILFGFNVVINIIADDFIYDEDIVIYYFRVIYNDSTNNVEVINISMYNRSAPLSTTKQYQSLINYLDDISLDDFINIITPRVNKRYTNLKWDHFYFKRMDN